MRFVQAANAYLYSLKINLIWYTYVRQICITSSLCPSRGTVHAISFVGGTNPTCVVTDDENCWSSWYFGAFDNAHLDSDHS